MEELTIKEKIVKMVNMIMERKKNKEISLELGMSIPTVYEIRRQLVMAGLNFPKIAGKKQIYVLTPEIIEAAKEERKKYDIIY